MRKSTEYLPSLILLAGMAFVMFVAPQIALAADDSWVEPGVEAAGNIEAGLVTLGAVLVGIGVIVAGIIAVVMGKLEWPRLIYCIIGGILIMAGPAIIRGLINLSKVA
ncbi:MAG: TrbC/VirB2 family protein [Ferrovibrio sp.]|uniref:TrbC/VirB2 family protein n=1 Tax=Ferrovibrio sp. TaxID=1917215 RepID=UPI00391A1313